MAKFLDNRVQLSRDVWVESRGYHHKSSVLSINKNRYELVISISRGPFVWRRILLETFFDTFVRTEFPDKCLEASRLY